MCEVIPDNEQLVKLWLKKTRHSQRKRLRFEEGGM